MPLKVKNNSYDTMRNLNRKNLVSATKKPPDTQQCQLWSNRKRCQEVEEHEKIKSSGKICATRPKQVKIGLNRIIQKMAFGAKFAPTFSKKRSHPFVSWTSLMIVSEGKIEEMRKSKEICHQSPLEIQSAGGEAMSPMASLPMQSNRKGWYIIFF